VGGFERGNQPLGAAQHSRRLQGFGIGDGHVLGASLVVQPGVLGSDEGIVQPRRDGVSEGDLPVVVLQQVAVGALQHARRAAAEARGVVAQPPAAPPSFGADELHSGLRHEGVEDAYGVAAAAHAGQHRVGQAPLGLQDLAAGLFTDHRLELAHHGGVGMRPQRAAQQVVGVVDIGHPVAHGLADSVLEGAAAGGHGGHPGSQQAHAEDVEPLPAHVLLSHVDRTLQAEQRAYRGGGHTVLSGAGLGDHPALAHAAGQQHLTQAVVDLVCAGVEQVLALEVEARTAQLFAQAPREVQRCGTPGVIAQQVVKFRLERGVFARQPPGRFQLLQRGHEHFGHVAAPVWAVVPRFDLRVCIHRGARAARKNAAIFT